MSVKTYKKYDVVRFLDSQTLTTVIKKLNKEGYNLSKDYKQAVLNLSGKLGVIDSHWQGGYSMFGNNPNFYTSGVVNDYGSKWVFEPDLFTLAE